MPAQQHSPQEPPTEQLVLAAIERAYRQRPIRQPGVLFSVVKEHLGLDRHAASTRRLQPIWGALHAAGEIESTRRQGLTLWRLSSEHIEPRVQAA